MEKLSDEVLKQISEGEFIDPCINRPHLLSQYPGRENILFASDLAAEVIRLRADADTSQNHNAAVIDPLITQLRDAGYTGTLSEMIQQACELATNGFGVYALPVPPEGGAK